MTIPALCEPVTKPLPLHPERAATQAGRPAEAATAASEARTVASAVAPAPATAAARLDDLLTRWQAGASLGTIALALGISRQRVQALLRAAGLGNLARMRTVVLRGPLATRVPRRHQAAEARALLDDPLADLLTVRQRAVLLLRAHAFTLGATGAVLGISPSQAWRHIAVAKLRLREIAANGGEVRAPHRWRRAQTTEAPEASAADVDVGPDPDPALEAALRDLVNPGIARAPDSAAPVPHGA